MKRKLNATNKNLLLGPVTRDQHWPWQPAEMLAFRGNTGILIRGNNPKYLGSNGILSKDV